MSKNSNLGVEKFKRVSPKDQTALSSLLEKEAKGSDEWLVLNKKWITVYGYSLRVQLIFDFIEKLIVPSGKGKGTPLKLRDWQKAFIRDIYNPVKADSLIRIVLRAILSVGRKNGKGLALDTPIPTPNGWKVMGNIQQGDYVYGIDGNRTKVSFVSEVHTGLRCWRLTFSDGSSVVADEDHQWFTTYRYAPWEKHRVNSSGNGGRCKSGVVTTPQIAMSVKVGRLDNGNESNHKINCARGVKSDNISLPISPYLLGVWLGDGSSNCAQITCGDEDIENMFNLLSCEFSHDIHIIKHKDRSSTISLSDGVRIKKKTKECLQKELRKLNLIKNKHIPDIYFNAGTEQRWALLQGLMDTDGTVTKCGGRTTPRCSFSTTKEPLAIGIWRVARSLGLKATIKKRVAKLYGREVGFKYDVAFPSSIDNKIFRLERKQSLLPNSLGKRSGTLTIVSCEEVESVPTKCIQVESEDKLFLCGHGCIPTHNTLIISCLVLVHLVGPEATKNGEIYSAANEREQAAIVFKYVSQIIIADPELGSYITVVPSTKTMLCVANGSTYKAVSAEAGTKFGYNPTVVIYDELAQAKNTELYNAFDTAMGARMEAGEEPLFIVISTQSKDPQHILSQLIKDGTSKNDPTTVCHLYTAPLAKEGEKCDALTNESKWYLANPALGDFRSLVEMRTFAKKAIRMPMFENEFRNFYLNQCVDAKSPLIPRAEWMACAGNAKTEPGSPIILGLDLSGKTDLTALIGVSDGEEDRVNSWFWKPEDSIDEHERRDHVPYSLWKRQGHIRTTPGKAIQYSFIAQELAEISKTYTIIGLAFDRYRIDDLRTAMDAIGLESYIEHKDKDGNPVSTGSGIRLVPWGQGYVSMTQAVEALEGSVLNRQLVHDSHPCLTWNISNAMVISDAAGNRKLDKSAVRFRIDGAVALAMAIGLKSRDRKGLPRQSIYAGKSADEILAAICI